MLDVTAAYETATGRLLWQVELCCNGTVVTPDDRHVAILGPGDAMSLYELATGRLANRWQPPGVIAFSPDLERGLIAAELENDRGEPVAANIGHVLDTDDHEVFELRGSGAGVAIAAWSPDGARIATATDTTVTLWDPSDLNDAVAEGLQRYVEPQYSFSVREGGIQSLVFGPESQTIATGLGNGTIVLWELGDSGAEPTPHARGSRRPCSPRCLRPRWWPAGHERSRRHHQGLGPGSEPDDRVAGGPWS